jgi:uncharacterized membrane protein YhaH (DUF805 family)
VAEAKAAEEGKLRAAAETKVAEEGKLRAAAEAKAAEEARAALVKAQVAEEAQAKAAAEAKFRATAEAKAAEEARAALVKAQAEEEARAKAAAEAKLRAAAEAMAAAEGKLRVVAEAKAAEEGKRRMVAEAKAAEEGKLRAAAETKAAEEGKLRAAAEAKAAEEARAALVKAQVAEEERAREAVEARAAADALRDEKRNATEAAITTTAVVAAEAKTGSKQKGSSVSAKSVWFYTCEGDRLGPVSFEELRAMAASTSLNPRLDMVWKQSMNEWQPAGQIDGLFERRSGLAGPKETLAPPADPYHRPQQQVSRAQLGKDAVWPGARRRSFLLVSLVFPYAWQFALSAGSPFLDKQFGSDLMGSILPVAALVPLVLGVYFGLNRLLNLGMSRWWSLAVFVPILNIWVGYRCFACPAGYAYHKEMDGPGIALAILYSLMILLCVLLLAALVAVVFGAIDSPELQGQLREAIRSSLRMRG